MTDSHSYNEALSTLSNIGPNEILLHDGCKSRILSRKIEDHLSSKARILYISRQYFDQDRGADMLKKVIVGDVDADLVARYTVLAGTYCLLRYLENCEGNSFGRHTLRVEYCTSTVGRMSIDRRTAINLELISNLKNGSQKESLFGAVNYTKTVVGARLLRANILRPSTDITTLEMRLDVVELLLSNNKWFTEIVKLLKQLPDLDKMLSGLSVNFKTPSVKAARLGIDTLIYLKQTLQIAPFLADALEGLISSSQSNNNFNMNNDNNNSNNNDNSNSNNRNDNNSSNNNSNNNDNNNNNNNNDSNNNSNSKIYELIKVFSKIFRAECFTVLRAAISDIFTDSTVYYKSALEVCRYYSNIKVIINY